MFPGDGQAGGEIQLLGLQLLQAIPSGGGKDALLDGCHDIFQGTVCIGQLLLQQGQLGVGGGLQLVSVGRLGNGPDGFRV